MALVVGRTTVTVPGINLNMPDMIKKVFIIAAMAFGLLATACNKDIEMPQEPDFTQTPITITAKYGDGISTKVSYTESGANITATWETGDQIYVVYDGHVNTLNLTGGYGTATATFEGALIGTPKATSVLICYVKDKNNPDAVNVSNTGEYDYAAGVFTSQDGTLAGAAKCNVYFGTTTFGDGKDITCNFSTNTSMLKFSCKVVNGLSEGDGTTLTYKSGNTTLAQASFTVGSECENTIYMTVPAGKYTGEQAVVYGSGSDEQCFILSDTQANFTAGRTYSKSLRLINLACLNSDYEAQDGDILIGTLNSHVKVSVNTDNATVTLRGVNISCLATGDGWAGLHCASSTNLVLEGTNTLIGGFDDEGAGNYPGLFIEYGKTLTISGSGSLEARCGTNGSAAGIGGAYNTGCGSIVINAGTIIAQGGSNSAGIGTGYGTTGTPINFGDISINGGTVTATGGVGGAGIGCGSNANNTFFGKISISGGTVTATGGQYAPGIGSGFAMTGSFHPRCGDISITGGTVEAIGGEGGDYIPGFFVHSYGAAGIGTGSVSGRSGELGSSACGDITITDGVTRVTARKGSDATNSIGENHSQNHNANNPHCGTITIGGTVYPSGISTSPYIYQP